MKLSVVFPEGAAGRAPASPDPALEAFPGTLERLTWATPPPGCGSPVDDKNRAWRRARGEWVLFGREDVALPPLACFQGSPAADLLCAGPLPEPAEALALEAPFALRRTFLEALGGFSDLPGGTEDFELGLRAVAAGARILPVPAWPEPAAAPPLDYEAALALFVRHPTEWVLRHACRGTPGDDPAARFAARFGRPVPAQDRHSLEELADHLAEMSEPPLLPARELAWHLRGAVAAGFHGSGPGEARRYDRCHAGNWLRLNTPYFEAGADRNPCLRFPPSRLREGSRAEPLAITLEGRYEVEVDPAVLAGLGPSTLAVPLPVAGPELRDLELFAFEPPDFGPDAGGQQATARLPLRPAPGREVRLGYGFRCTVQEGGLAAGGGPVPLPQPAALGPGYQAQLDGILAGLFGGAPAGPPRVRARRIYDWILDHVPFLWSERAGLFALDARAGNCAHRARLFALLCQRAGLAARERSGALVGDLHRHGVEEGRPWADAVRVERGHPVLHVWADVFLENEGWLPVDFLGADSGARRMTPRNVRDPATRARLQAWTPRLDDYFFGHLDPYRIHFGAPPKAFAGIPSGVPGEDLGALWKVAWGTRHTLRTRMSGLPPPLSLEEHG